MADPDDESEAQPSTPIGKTNVTIVSGERNMDDLIDAPAGGVRGWSEA
jgi:hypothetical protein